LSSRRWSKLLGVVAAGAVFAAPESISLAEPPAAPALAGDRESEARAHFKRGVELLERDAWAEALAEFLASRRIYPRATATTNAIICLRRLGRYDEALELIEALLREFPDLPAEKRIATEAEAAELSKLVGVIVIEDAEPGAALAIDGRERGTFPAAASVRVTAGSHMVRVSKSGFERFWARIEVAAEQTVRVVARMQVLPLAARVPGIELVDGLVSYFGFDESSSGTGAAVDQSRNNGVFLGTARRTTGLVGRGAARFNGVGGDAVELEPGVGNSFSLTSGVTIEALFATRWDGSTLAEIFRKEDGKLRILLSFQPPPYITSVESGAAGAAKAPGVAFGLNVGGSYGELDIPFDGRNGRPTLAAVSDGKTHHVVATYDAASGDKIVWLDGRVIGSTNLGRNQPIASGGRATAKIGANDGAEPSFHGFTEPFDGTIDEVAIYGVALTASDIARHYGNIRHGRSYFAPNAAGADSPSEAEQTSGGRFRLELDGAALIAPTFGGQVADGCTGVCSRSLGLGGYGALRGGYAITPQVSLGLTAGFVAANQSITGRSTTLKPVGLNAREGTVDDTLKLRGVLAGAWAGLLFGERRFVELRFGAGALLGWASDTRTGTFGVAVGPDSVAPFAAFVYVNPEVRVGIHVSERIALTAGIEGLLLASVSQPAWDATYTVDAKSDGAATFLAESLIGQVVLGLAPSVGVRYEF
jgi:hypothetical protein